jgi:hypothetical protein
LQHGEKVEIVTASTCPVVLQEPIEHYLALAQTHVPGLLDGFYLTGSAALGAFEPGHSDVDFLAIVRRAPSAADMEGLRALHQAYANDCPQFPLDGGYIEWAGLGRVAGAATGAAAGAAAGEMAPFPFYNEGRLGMGYHEAHPVGWWLLKRHGIAVMGPEPAALDFSASWEAVTAYMARNLDTYWAGWTRRPTRLAALLTDYGVEWAVLGICRLVDAAERGDLHAKWAAGEYCLRTLPAGWHPLLREALALRQKSSITHATTLSIAPARLGRAWAARAFLQFAILRCRETLASLTLR